MKKNYTDKELVQMIQSDNLRQIAKAKDFLYHTHYSPITKWLQPLPPKINVEDIFIPKLTDLVLDIQTGKTVISKQATLKTNLYTYCRYGKNNEQRDYNRQTNLKDKTLPPKAIENVLTAMAKKERKIFIASLISKMTKNCQDSLIMFHFKEIKHKEIAENMAFKSEQQSRNLLSNCKKKLRKMILSHSNWEDLLNS